MLSIAMSVPPAPQVMAVSRTTIGTMSMLTSACGIE
jgi:hypothetical protein